jgi:putative two-component system response regulator
LSDPTALPQSKILVIDDIESNVILMRAILERAGHEVHGCCESVNAVELMRSLQPDLIVLDLHMPGMSGYEVLAELRKIAPDSNELPVLVFTADVGNEAKLHALELGASDFLTKPGDATEIMLRVRSFLQAHHMYRRLQSFNELLEKKVTERTRALWDAQLEILERLTRAVDLRDNKTCDHAKRVGDLSAAIAVEMGLSHAQVELIRLAAPLHDIGKIGVPDNILQKRGALTDWEMRSMKSHPQQGADLLSGGRSAVITVAEKIALTHHERWDGTGYPNGLAGTAIPIEGRVVSVADVFDALTTERPYRTAMSGSDALAYILGESELQFDPDVVQAFLRVVAQGSSLRRAA